VTAVLRPATVADHSQVTALLARLGLPLAGVSSTLDGFVVAEGEGGVVGTAAMEHYGTVGLLRSVAVDPARRGTGLGGSLVEYVLGRAGAAGINDVFLLTTTAERYFPRHGFAVASREAVPAALAASEEFRGACPASAVLMRRRLGQP